MLEKYSCPKCGKELDEKYVISCICPHCHGIFDKPTIQQVSFQADQEKEDLEEGGADKKREEEHEELPSKTINGVQLLALFLLLIILLVSYFTISKIATNKKATQERLQLAILQQQKEEENTKQEEILQVGKLKETEEMAPLPTSRQGKEEEEKRQAGILQAKKLQEAEDRVTRAEKLQQETEKALKETRLAVQDEILQAKKLQEAEEKAAKAVKLQQEAEKALEETRLAAQKKEERQFQYYYDKGEAAIRQSGGAVYALEFYQMALTYKPEDQKTQEKINYILAVLKSAQKAKQAESKPQETKKVETKIKEVEKKTETITSEKGIKTKAAKKIDIGSLVPPGTKVFIPGMGFNVIQPGDIEKILRIFGNPETISNGRSRWKIMSWRKHSMDLRVDTVLGIIEKIRFNKGFNGNLANGIKIGDSLGKVLKKYGIAPTAVSANREFTPSEITPYYFRNVAEEGVLFGFDRNDQLIQIVISVNKRYR